MESEIVQTAVMKPIVMKEEIDVVKEKLMVQNQSG